MSDEELKAQEAEKQKQQEAEKKALEGKTATELIEIIRETRSEAKERRLKTKELEDRLKTIEDEKQKQEQDKKLAEGKKDEVIQDLQKKYDEAAKKATQWEDYNKKKREKIKEGMKDNWLDSFELIPLDELEKLASKFEINSSLLDSDNGKGKKLNAGKLEGLKNDLKLAIQKNDVTAQLQIKRLIKEEEEKRK